MSPTSYLAAPSRVNYKEDVGFEPTHAFTRLTVFKTVPFSRTWVILQNSPYGIRTRVTAVKRRCLNPLTNGPNFMGTSGLEPPTSRLSGVRSNHLSYAPISSGGDEEDRTPDPLRARQVLSQLSYTPI